MIDSFASNKASCQSLNRQNGLTLIEMMIALVLGLILVSALINIYVGSTRSSSFTRGLQSVQENGRHGISVLQRDIRLAGFTNSSVETMTPFDIVNADENTIIVRKREEFDCNGQPTTGNDGVAINTYRWIEADQEIVCRGGSSAATDMVLVENVEGFRVLYGVDTDGDFSAESYVPFDGNLNPDLINSVRVGLLIGSGDPIRTRRRSETFALLDREYSTNDRIARQVFTATLMLRNRF